LSPSKPQPPFCHRLGKAAWLGLLGLTLGLSSRGCLVTEKCYADVDCPDPQVCTAAGQCQIVCRVDEDCDRDFGVAYVCQEHRCVEPTECTLCSFAHADSSCVHGDCRPGDCLPGYADANLDMSDGCEYACTPNGEEVCDGQDNDCDAEIDENTDLAIDPLHCGRCGNVCPSPPHTEPVCDSGSCKTGCQAGYHDNDGLAENGCESVDCVPNQEVCDGQDNDCDGSIDEGFVHDTVGSCGPFCTVCQFDHAEPSCLSGVCRMGACEPGWIDADALAATGCETACTPSGEEVCDGLDNDCDGSIDEESVCQPTCPPDMVAVSATLCVDRYEASRADATLTDAGQDQDLALSRPAVLPWMVNPMTAEHLQAFQAACAAANKELCTAEQWGAACTGPEQYPYVYGDSFDREACNCVDTFCDDYCAEQGIDTSSCQLGQDCGYTYNCFHVVPTGQFPRCTNAWGTYDINGNLWEAVLSNLDARGYELRGGAFNCANAPARVSCSFNANWQALYAGFRCCKTLD